MIIERKNNEVIVRLPDSVDTSDLQEMLDYLRYKEITSKSRATQEDADNLAKEAKKGRWKRDRNRLLDE